MVLPLGANEADWSSGTVSEGGRVGPCEFDACAASLVVSRRMEVREGVAGVVVVFFNDCGKPVAGPLPRMVMDACRPALPG